MSDRSEQATVASVVNSGRSRPRLALVDFNVMDFRVPDPLLDCLRPNVSGMAGYAPGEQLNRADIVKLNTNECPYPPSPEVFGAIRQALTGDTLRKYPEPTGETFRRAAAEVYNVAPEMILCGNGSDDLLTILVRAYAPEGGTVVSPTPSYTLYKSLAEIQGASFTTVPFKPDWSLPDPWPLPDADLTFLPNPNSPSGSQLRNHDVVRLAEQLRGPLILDEAYADFAEWHGLDLVGRVPNVIVTRSLSKFYGLAGVRFGFLVAPEPVVAQLVKVKDSYNCDALSLAAATAAVRDQAYYADVRERVVATRGRLAAGLMGLGFAVQQSQANFVWGTRGDGRCRDIYLALKERGILVRHMAYPGVEGLRVSVGTPDETERLIAELRTIV